MTIHRKPELTKKRSSSTPGAGAKNNCMNCYIKERLWTLLIVMSLLLMCMSWIITTPEGLCAAEVTELRQVPSTLSDPLKSQFISGRAILANRLTELRLKFSQFDKDCADVEEDSAEDSYCQATAGRLTDKLSAYDSDVKKINRLIAVEEGVTVLIGNAFRMGSQIRAYAHKSLNSAKDISRVLIGAWHAERGSYQKARHLARFPDISQKDEILNEIDDILLSLEREQRELLKKSITRLVISGDFNSRFFSQYPDKFSISLLQAHMNIKSQNYDAALNKIASAKIMNIESQALAEAETYVRQMKISAIEKLTPTDPALITHQKNLAGAYAGWSLGLLLMDSDMDATAIQILNTSAQTLAREGETGDSTILFRLINKIPEKEEKNRAWLPSSSIYDYASEADILLDSLEYGRGDWKRSLLFLELAHKASPGNEKINEAIAHTQALIASQR